MGKKLAIQGHLTRGKEIMELFKMMGGCECGYCGGGTGLYYYISQFGNIEASCKPYEFVDYIVYTLEEFLEKFPFKVGDKVFLYDNITEGYVTGMKWDEINETVKYCVYTSAECWCDVKELLKWNAIYLVEKHYDEQCGEMMKDITLKHLYENGMENINKFPSFEPMFNMNDELEYKIPDGYEITEVIKDKVFIKPIKSNYPKTYVECCEMIAKSKPYAMNEHYTDINKLLQTLQNLLICRNVYWKIAGEQMRLGKPWEPDWTNEDKKKYCIYYSDGNIQKGTWSLHNSILAFPTEEMRDMFYENFKDLIEQCKVLL